MYALWLAGPIVERWYGRVRFLRVLPRLRGRRIGGQLRVRRRRPRGRRVRRDLRAVRHPAVGRPAAPPGRSAEPGAGRPDRDADPDQPASSGSPRAGRSTTPRTSAAWSPACGWVRWSCRPGSRRCRRSGSGRRRARPGPPSASAARRCRASWRPSGSASWPSSSPPASPIGTADRQARDPGARCRWRSSATGLTPVVASAQRAGGILGSTTLTRAPWARRSRRGRSRRGRWRTRGRSPGRDRCPGRYAPDRRGRSVRRRAAAAPGGKPGPSSVTARTTTRCALGRPRSGAPTARRARRGGRRRQGVADQVGHDPLDRAAIGDEGQRAGRGGARASVSDGPSSTTRSSIPAAAAARAEPLRRSCAAARRASIGSGRRPSGPRRSRSTAPSSSTRRSSRAASSPIVRAARIASSPTAVPSASAVAYPPMTVSGVRRSCRRSASSSALARRGRPSSSLGHRVEPRGQLADLGRPLERHRVVPDRTGRSAVASASRRSGPPTDREQEHQRQPDDRRSASSTSGRARTRSARAGARDRSGRDRTIARGPAAPAGRRTVAA